MSWGEGDKNVTGGVTELSRGGVTEKSPKEYTNNNKNISKRTLEKKVPIVDLIKAQKRAMEKQRSGLVQILEIAFLEIEYFEIYDNLNDLKSTEQLVEEGIHRACKDVMVNRANDLEKLGVDVNIKSLVSEVKNKFPYQDFPTNNSKAREFLHLHNLYIGS